MAYKKARRIFYCIKVTGTLMSAFLCLEKTGLAQPQKNNSQSPAAASNQTNRNNAKAKLETVSEVKAPPAAPPSRFPLSTTYIPMPIIPKASLLRNRIMAAVKTPDEAEPITLRILSSNAVGLLEQLGKKSFYSSNNNSADERGIQYIATEVLSRATNARLTLVPKDLEWLDLEKLANVLKFQSVQPFMATSTWENALRDSARRDELEQYFGRSFEGIRANISAFLKKTPDSEKFPLQLTLPAHFQKIFGQFSPWRGRNCFATALAFADKNVELSSIINSVREAGHAKAMINHDEFSHALWLGYYELSLKDISAGLRFGDVVTFNEQSAGDAYTAIRHAAVHVMGDIYVHKQSKSASTPIEFTRWEDVASTWATLTENLEYRVYRKLPIGKRFYQKQESAIEKIFWNQ